MKNLVKVSLPGPHPALKKFKKARLTFFVIGRALGVSTSTAWSILTGRVVPTPEQESKLTELAEAAIAGRLLIAREK